MNSLCSKEARACWEKEFNALYLRPVLKKLDDTLNNVMDLIANDEKQGKHIVNTELLGDC